MNTATLQRPLSKRTAYRCIDGPWKGRTIELEQSSGGYTLQLNIRGEIGRYLYGKWQPASKP